ncbi:hypothetical protein ACFL3S_08970 [Gemmatimonadota bacterium]
MRNSGGNLVLVALLMAFGVGSYFGFRLWGGAGILFWSGILLSYLAATRLSTAWYGVKIFSFALAGTALILGGGSILAKTVGVWAVVPWFIACVVFLWRLRKRLFKPIW